MNPVLVVVAAGTGVAGAVLLYLASPQQSWRAAGPWPARARGWPGGLCVLVSLLALLQLLGALAAAFTWLTLLMLVWSVMPFAGAWRARHRKRANR